MKIKIYSGLSLKSEQVAKLLPQAVFSGPIKRRDIIQDIKNGFQVIGIIDGEFLQNLAVSPSEISDAIRCGLKVYGSSSMGAMRAVELNKYGMIGCGRIFEYIHAQAYFKDDQLGQLFFGENSPIQTLPFLDLKLGIDDLCQLKKLTKQEAALIIREYERLHFSERSFGALRGRLRKNKKDDLVKKLATIEKKIGSSKEKDGILMLKQIKSDLEKVRKLNSRINLQVL